MTHTDILKQIVHSNKSLFDNSYEAGVALQEEAEKAVGTYLDTAPWINNEAKNAITVWTDNVKKGQQDFKAVLDKNFNSLEELLTVRQN